MSKVLQKFSSQMDEQVLAELRDYARESNQPISAILTEAVSAHLRNARLRPAFREAARQVLEENAELLLRLAK